MLSQRVMKITLDFIADRKIDIYIYIFFPMGNYLKISFLLKPEVKMFQDIGFGLTDYYISTDYILFTVSIFEYSEVNLETREKKYLEMLFLLQKKTFYVVL